MRGNGKRGLECRHGTNRNQTPPRKQLRFPTYGVRWQSESASGDTALAESDGRELRGVHLRQKPKRRRHFILPPHSTNPPPSAGLLILTLLEVWERGIHPAGRLAFSHALEFSP